MLSVGHCNTSLGVVLNIMIYTGMTLSPNFSRRSTHLLCPSRTGAKHDKALEWGIPVIGMEWMSEIARTGTIPVTAVSEANSWDDMYADVTEQPIPDKGKGKARAVDSRIMDVTNSMCSVSAVSMLVPC